MLWCAAKETQYNINMNIYIIIRSDTYEYYDTCADLAQAQAIQRMYRLPT